MNNIREIIREHIEKINVIFDKSNIDLLGRCAIRDEIRQSQAKLAKAILEKMTASTVKVNGDYEIGYNKRIEVEIGIKYQILKELE